MQRVHKEQRQFRSQLPGQILVVEVDAVVERIDEVKRTATVAIQGWLCDDVMRIDMGEYDLQAGYRFVLTAMTAGRWHEEPGGCLWKPSSPMVARRVVVELSEEELAGLRAQQAGEAPQVDLRADLVLRLERVVRIRAKPIKFKFFERWISSKPLIEAIKAVPVAWQFSISGREVKGH